MQPTIQIDHAWRTLYARNLANCSAVRRIQEGSLTIAHYRAILRELYHYTRESTQIICAAAATLVEGEEGTLRRFARHGLSELGHHELALADLQHLGVSPEVTRRSEPLPPTFALIAFAWHQARHHGIRGYLGYMYFLERLATEQGSRYASWLQAIGVPPAAMGFLAEHALVDEGHVAAMQHYVEALIQDAASLGRFQQAMASTAFLYASMLDAAVAAGDAELGVSSPALAGTLA